MRFGVGRRVVDDLHLVARNIDQLLVLGVEGTDRQEAVLGKFVERDQPLAVGAVGLAIGGVDMPDLVVDVDLVDDRILTGHRLGDIPLGHRRVEE